MDENTQPDSTQPYLWQEMSKRNFMVNYYKNKGQIQLKCSHSTSHGQHELYYKQMPLSETV